MAVTTYPSADTIRQLIHYDPMTGVFTWKKRMVSEFMDGTQSAEHNCNIWNGKFAYKTAGCTDTNGYCKIRMHNKLYFAHVLAWIYVYGETPAMDIDHINMKRSDNRIVNLRLATRSQNMGNTVAHSDNMARRKGVYFDRRGDKWCARIYAAGKQRNLGRFRTAEAASAAYAAAAIEIFGNFARCVY